MGWKHDPHLGWMTTEPLICSQGGVPYNKPHLDARDAEIARLYDELLEARKLSHEWMKKHDRLLGFIQARPAVLKELIEDERPADNRSVTR